LNRVSLKTRLKTVFDLPRAVWDSSRILSDFRADIVIGVGGYASGPAMLAAILRRVPTLVFEPNFVPGFANRLVAPLVSGAAVHFADTGRYFRRCEVTGVPVREAFFQIANRNPTNKRTLLVFGGSQGAHAINQVVMDSVADLRQRVPGIHIVHQTGERDYNDAQAAYANLGASVEVYRFIDDMPGLFAKADLLICRSGASTVAEVTAAGKPAVFIPFPRAADDHQKRNAEALKRAGAAVMLEESNLNRESLVDVVRSLFSEPSRLEKMGDAARKLSHPNAARDIAAMAARLAGIEHV
jgi:UDP-N-acetylglucosamine--N-acetylmuramyl-(pentapeptide) pyrophosphoryl-undecaprenol N-acetylglucosamine transferase